MSSSVPVVVLGCHIRTMPDKRASYFNFSIVRHQMYGVFPSLFRAATFAPLNKEASNFQVSVLRRQMEWDYIAEETSRVYTL
jgi:hypothetical protein